MNPVTSILSVVLLIFSVVIHEVSHGLRAVAEGDPTPRVMGRLTLNPLKHLDPLGSVILPALLIFTGSPVVFGWAKPVLFDPRNFVDKKWGPVRVALAGPLANIALVLIGALAAHVLTAAGVYSIALGTFLSVLVLVNLSLAIFNLIPVPPLDGHYLLFALLPASATRLRSVLQQSSFLLMALVLFVLWQFISPLVLFLYQGLMPGF